jgi:DNA repair protein RadA/Sms
MRTVSQLEARLNEAAKLGFRRAIVPAGGRRGSPGPQSLEVLPARSLQEALRFALG